MRVPVVEPPAVRNVYGICQTISALQFIIFAPYLLQKILDNNECSPDVCNILNKVNSTNTCDMVNIDDKFVAAYLIHEIMILMGGHQVNEDLLDDKSDYSIGSQLEDDVSFCLHNFHRLIMIRLNFQKSEAKNCAQITLAKNRNFTVPLNSTIKSGTPLVLDFDGEELFENSIHEYKLTEKLANEMSFLLKYIFYGAEYVPDKEITREIYREQGALKVNCGSEPLLPIEDINAIVYHPPIKLLHLQRNYNFSKTIFRNSFTEYIRNYIVNPSFLMYTTEHQPWMKNKFRNIIRDHGFPKIVIDVQQLEFTPPYASKINLDSHFELNDKLNELTDKKMIERILANEENLDQTLQMSPVKVVQFPLIISDIAWNNGRLESRKLFGDIAQGDFSATYLIYAFHIGHCSPTLELSDTNYSYPVPLPEGVHDWNNHRIEEILNDVNLTNLSHCSDEEQGRVKKYLRSFINRTIWKETLVTAGNFYYGQQNSEGQVVEESVFIMHEEFDNYQHSMAIVKSLVGSVWHLVNNEEIHRINDLRIFLTRKDRHRKVREDFLISDILWHEETSYNKHANNLNKILKPLCSETHHMAPLAKRFCKDGYNQ